jgi:Ca2+-transporting ATPase
MENPSDGWEEATAIYIAVALCSLIGATNNYSKQLQFKALEESVAADDQSSVLRNGAIERIHSKDVVVGDILILQVRYSLHTLSLL